MRKSQLSLIGMVDYRMLAQPDSLKDAVVLLPKLLAKGRREFDALFKLKPAAVNFKNVVEAYLGQGRELSVRYAFIESFNGTNSNPVTRDIIEKFQPKLVAFYNYTTLNPAFYALLKKINKDKKLTSLQRRSLELLMREMEVAGVHTSPQTRKKLEKINTRLSALAEKFENNVIDSRKEFFYTFEDVALLKEMPDANLAEAREEAVRRGLKGKYVFTLSQPSMVAIMKYCSDRAVRELFYKKNSVIATEGAHDNRPLVLELLQLRATKAHVLGKKNYLEYVLQERMAHSEGEIAQCFREISKRALVKGKKEIKELAEFAGVKSIEEWDLAFYGERLRQKIFAVDEKKLREFFPLHHVLHGLFEIMERLFCITLKPLKVASYDESVKTFEVYSDGVHIAYYVADFYARPAKRGGAWCNDLRRGTMLPEGGMLLPIIINVMNFAKGSNGAPPLLTHRDVETLFHEFGHAVHAMLSSTTYNNLTGFGTEWDFVEFPSQILENWCWEPSSLKLFARHHKTGKVLPTALINKLRKSQTFMSGMHLVRQLEFGALDLALHTMPPPRSVAALDLAATKSLRAYRVLPKFVGYKMYASFGHIFAGGYAAGYYSYLWAEILEADCFAAIKKAGILKPSVGRRYAEKILAPGARKPGARLFKDFMGRAPDVKALLKKHGL